MNLIFCYSGFAAAEESAKSFVSRGLEAALNNKDYYKAIRIYSKGIDKYPRNYELYFCRGCAYRNLEQYEEAIENILQSARLAGGFDFKMHEALAKCYFALGKQRHFTRELTMRLIFHTLKVAESQPELEKSPLFMKGLKDDLKYLEDSSFGGISFVLPPDIVGERDKLQFLDIAKKKVEKYYKENTLPPAKKSQAR